MDVKILGAGSFFSTKFNNTSFIITGKTGKTLLFDCGGDIKSTLHTYGISVGEIDEVYISHAHGDHCHGLEYFGFYNYFMNNRKTKLTIAESVLSDVRNVLSPMTYNNNFDVTDRCEKYFDITRIQTIGASNPMTFKFDGLEFKLVQADHVKTVVPDKMTSTYNMPCFGLYEETTKTWFTGDTNVMYNHALYNEANTIYHDCDFGTFRTGVHANYNDLNNLSADIKSKMHLIHYNFKTTEDFMGACEQANEDGFRGLGLEGSTYTSNEVENEVST